MKRAGTVRASGGHHGHWPALDGLRGLAVVGVVAFHAEWSWAGGGFLGVSTFFTLSGFLITRLLVGEREATGRVDLRAFWCRRARRLLPAAVTTLLAVAALAPALATADQLAALRGDVVAALLHVANWRFVVDDRTYADLFAAPSPVLHFWSLAIEEQLYALLPVLVVVARRRLALVLAVLLAASVASGVATEAYYGTHVRAAELLVGALLAVLAMPRRHFWRRRIARTVGVVALAGMLWAWTAVTVGEPALYRGGFVVHAVASAAVVAACLADGGPVRWLLSLAPLRALGRISYGVYLIHWPVLVWSDWPVAAELALTLALAAVSYVVVEQPVRLSRVRVPFALVPASAVVVAGVVVASTLAPPRTGSFELAAAAPAAPGAPSAPSAPSAPRVAMFGDSTALRTGFALRGYGWTTRRIDVRDGAAEVGCPLVGGGVVDYVVADEEPEARCERWPSTWRSLATGLDAAVVQIGPWDVTDRRLDGEWTHIGETGFDARLEASMHEAVDALSAGGALVVWLTAPHIEFAVDRRHPINDPARIDRLNELLARVDASREELVVLDLAGHLRSLPGGEMDPALRPDGVHFSEEGSAGIAEWLAGRIIELVGGS